MSQLHYFSSLGFMGLPSTLYFLCFHYFESVAAHSHFSTSYTAHGLLFSLFPGSFKPIYLFKTNLFISWACNPLFMSLGLNGFSIRLQLFSVRVAGLLLPTWASKMALNNYLNNNCSLGSSPKNMVS